MMDSANCVECDSLFVFDEFPRRGAVCFKCHVHSVRLGFSHGKKDFHGPTIKERQQHQVAQAKAAGINAEPVGNRWV